jgi:hypothetical protein
MRCGDNLGYEEESQDGRRGLREGLREMACERESAVVCAVCAVQIDR